MSQPSPQVEHRYHFRWQPNWKLLLFAAIFLPLTLTAGFWQLDRADEKRRIAAEYEVRQSTAALNLDQLLAKADPAWYQVTLEGEYASDYFLLDNRVMNGQVGYEVLSPFLVEGGWLLVNRGWVLGSPDRSQLPVVATPKGKRSLAGEIYTLSPKYRTLDETLASRWPKVIQTYNFALLNAEVAGELLLPVVVRLGADQPGALRVDWQVINMQPEKHTGYAVQWFGMALALVIMSLIANSNIAERFRKSAPQQDDSQS